TDDVEGADQVDLDDADKLVERHRPVPSEHPRRGRDPGSIDRAAEAAEFADACVYGIPDVAFAGDIGPDEARVRAQSRGRRSAGRFVDVRDDDTATGGNDHLGGRAAEA